MLKLHRATGYDQTWHDNRPTFSGYGGGWRACQGILITVFRWDSPRYSNGFWTFTPSQNLGEGAHRLTVIATDAKGNASPAASFDTVVDTQSPQQPVITFITDDAPGILGSVSIWGSLTTARQRLTVPLTGFHSTPVSRMKAPDSGYYRR